MGLDSIRKTALTGYGMVGTDLIRATVAYVNGILVVVRADGSNAVLPELPERWRTSGDVVSVAATVGHRVNMAAVPSVAFPAHAWKSTMTLEEMAAKFGLKAEQVTELRANYAEAAAEDALAA